MKLIFKILLISFIGLATVIHTNKLQAKEQDGGLFVYDEQPWKMSWLQESDGTWLYICNFDSAQVTTYFKSAPNFIKNNQWEMDINQKPTKQEFEYYLTGETFIPLVIEESV